jgi:hypothetical protein
LTTKIHEAIILNIKGDEMDKDMMHLAKITLANLAAGSIFPSDEAILEAMNKAVAKEQDMTDQLMASKDKLGGALDQFAAIMAGMVYESANA